MNVEELFEAICAKAHEFGLIEKNDGKTIVEPKGNAIVRKNCHDLAFKEGAAYFGFLSPDEDVSGQYSDFSFVIFPDNKDDVKCCVVSLGVGSLGFKNDYQLASSPGLRRTFLKLKTTDNTTFFKTAFDDIENSSSDLLKEVKANYPSLGTVIDSYRTVLPASVIVTMGDQPDLLDKSLNILYTWLATYAKFRGWGTAVQKKTIANQLKTVATPLIPNYEEEVLNLLNKRRYVVLQGAPGTGKTHTALNIAKKYDKVFFEQFHAETTYSDFVWGLEPNMKVGASEPQFVKKVGILYRAIEHAIKTNERTLLIIDEINRANLSNVLGQVFFLFEYQSGVRSIKIKIGDLELTQLPENLHVIATMNTADRSLAVVDFALRRRFAWYTLRPHELKKQDLKLGKVFMKDIYNKFVDIFFEYATDDELNLQPGQSYFIVSEASKYDEMRERMVYELMPLIKEYLSEGYLLKAKNSFCDLFLKETGVLMYE